MLDIQLKDYQLECLEKVSSQISSGAKHLSVVMTTGTGQKITSLFLAKKLYSEEQVKIAMVFGYKAALMKTQADAKELGIVSVDYYSVNEYIHNESEYKYSIFHDLSTSERTQIQEYIRYKNNITISFCAPGQDLVSERVNPGFSKRMLAYAERLAPIVCVYVTNEVLDIRDVKYASKDENVFASKENANIANRLLQERIQTVNERDEIKKCSDRLQAYMGAVKESEEQRIIKEQAAEIKRLNALLQADERDKTIEELKVREIEYGERMREKDARIAQQDQMIAFQQDILSSFGIDASVIRDSFERIQSVRALLQEDLESNDEFVKETALKRLQDRVAEIVNGLTQSALSSKDQKYFEGYLIGELTEEVWEKIDDKSKAFLITAKSSYESMIKLKDSETFDYSGVCLLVTKALEVETTKRFFLSYKDYLTREYSSISCWPEALRKRKQGKITENVIDDNEFTLGTVVPSIGLKREYDTEGNIIAYTEANVKTKNEFIDYAKKDLFKFSDCRRVEMEIDKDIHFIEKVRLDYRNPAAHRDRMTITSAKECLEYVIDVQHPRPWLPSR